MLVRVSYFLLSFVLSLNLIAGEISLSFDDTPEGDKYYYPGKQRAEKILAALKKTRVEQAIFFANPGKIKKSKEKYQRLMNYHKAGHLVANHTHNHKNASEVGLKEFMQDFLNADIYLEELKIRAKYFRYPYLNRGKNKKEMDEIRKQILSFGYTDGYVTIDTYDWYIDWLYQEALKRKKKINYANLKRMYLDAILGSVEFYDNLAIKSLGYSPKHVLLLHESDVAALFLEDLVFQLKLDGWKIIKASDAYKDKKMAVYPNTDFHGQGRVSALAKAKGYKGVLRSKYESDKYLQKMFTEYGVILK